MEYYYIVNSETKVTYAKRETFTEAVNVAKRKVNGIIMTQTDWSNMRANQAKESK